MSSNLHFSGPPFNWLNSELTLCDCLISRIFIENNWFTLLNITAAEIVMEFGTNNRIKKKTEKENMKHEVPIGSFKNTLIYSG